MLGHTAGKKWRNVLATSYNCLFVRNFGMSSQYDETGRRRVSGIFDKTIETRLIFAGSRWPEPRLKRRQSPLDSEATDIAPET